MNIKTLFLRSGFFPWQGKDRGTHVRTPDSMLRIKNIVVRDGAQDTASFDAETHKDVIDRDMDGLSIALHRIDGAKSPRGEYVFPPPRKGLCNIYFSIPKSWLAEGATYGLSFKNKTGVCSYNVHWTFLNGQLVHKYFRKEEMTRRLLPLWAVILYALGTVAVLFVYQYAKGCTERYRKRLREIDEIIQDIQSQAENGGGHGNNSQ